MESPTEPESGIQGHSRSRSQFTLTHNDALVEMKTIPSGRYLLLSVGVCLGLFLAMLDTSIVATSIYDIGVEFKALSNVNWVVLAYTLAYMGCAVLFSRISDIVGRRNAFLAAYILFVGFSLGCGFSKSLHQLIAFRALQGVGGSGLYSLTMIMLPEMSPSHLKPHIGAMIGMVIAIAGVLGPVLGGILTNYTTWRWIFWINGPIGAASMGIFFFAWPKAEYLPPIKRRSWGELDYLGSLLTIAAAVLVVFSFQNAGASSSVRGGDWSKAIFIAPLAVGVVCWFALFAWQYVIQLWYVDRFAPAFPINLFRNRVYTTGVLNTLCLGYPYLMLIYSVPLRIQVVGGKSALLAGVMLLPMLGTVALGSIMAGKLNSSKNFIFETLLVGSCLMLLGCGLLTTLSTHLDSAKLLGFLTFCGLGFGLTVSSSTMLASFETPAKDFAPAQGILAQIRLLGGSLGVAASTAILGHQTSKHLAGVLTPQQQATLNGGHSQLSSYQRDAVSYAYAKAFRTNMITASVISAVAILVTLGAYRTTRRKVAMHNGVSMEEIMPPKDRQLESPSLSSR